MEQMEEKIRGYIPCEQTCVADLKESIINTRQKNRGKKSISVVRLGKKIIGQNRSPIPSLNVSGRSLILREKNKVIYQDNQNQNHAVPITSLQALVAILEHCVGHDFQKQLVMRFLFTKHFSFFALKWALLELFLEQRFLLNLVDPKHRYAKVKKEIKKELKNTIQC